MISTELDQLLRHMSWADALVWAEVMDLSDAGADSRAAELLHHVHSVQRVYLQLFQGQEVEIPELASFESPAALMSWGRDCHADLEEFTRDLDPEALTREITFPWAEELVGKFGQVHPTDVRQGLLQLASHSAYHRGQINTRIREIGGEPPLTDFVAWVWRGQPEAKWP